MRSDTLSLSLVYTNFSVPFSHTLSTLCISLVFNDLIVEKSFLTVLIGISFTSREAGWVCSPAHWILNGAAISFPIKCTKYVKYKNLLTGESFT